MPLPQHTRWATPGEWENERVTEIDALFAQLSREPDFDAPELFPYDATDRLILETARALGPRSWFPGEVVVIGDRHGALTLGAITLLGATELRVYQDPLLAERALAQNAAKLGVVGAYANYPLDASLLSGARLVLLQLPRSLAELDEIADAIARLASPDVVILAGGRVKHMTRAMNEVLGRSFHEVAAGLAQQKSRILTARRPKNSAELGEARFPVWGRDHELPFDLAAYGATFGGADLDHGSRLLLAKLNEGGWPEADRIVDLGCGNGVLATAAAIARPHARVIASDQSNGAVAAARLTVEMAGVGDRVEITRADATEAVPNEWADLVLLNPPFHTGAAVHAGVARRLIRSAARALRAGGELWLVFNSHLGYRPFVERSIGPTRQEARNRSFTVLSAVRNSRHQS